jgi:hypothetical protein
LPRAIRATYKRLKYRLKKPPTFIAPGVSLWREKKVRLLATRERCRAFY